jgi:hypothetical protein
VCENSLEAENCKYKLFIEHDIDFHNIMIADLFKYMRVNGTLHIVYTIVINEYVNNKVGELWLPMDHVCYGYLCQKQ